MPTSFSTATSRSAPATRSPFTMHRPTIAFGERIVVRRTATVVRAGLLDQIRARVQGYLELTELYEVSFSNGRV